MLKFIRSKVNIIYNGHSPKAIRVIAKLRLGLSHLREHKFKHSFQDYLNPLCLCGNDIKTSSHFLFHCLNYLNKRMTFLNKLETLIMVYWT